MSRINEKTSEAKYRRTAGVIGPGGDLCSPELYDFARELGRELGERNYTVVCGGMGGVMEAVCRGAREATAYRFGRTMGILPGTSKDDANAFVDVAIPTGLGHLRNQTVVLSADVIIALAGGAGTLSELSFAWMHRRPVICCTAFAGWARQLAGVDLDGRAHGLFYEASSVAEICALLETIAA